MPGGGFLVALAAALAAPPDRPGEKPAVPEVRLDFSQVPELKEWAEKAKTLCEKWRPRIVEILGADGDPGHAVTLVFKKDKDGVASTSGATITISADWIKKHPEDFGMVVHELTHVVQAYPRNQDAGWLVEGIADYVRYYHFEPGAHRHRVNAKASYRDGYGTAAAFLAWTQKKYDKKLVPKLNGTPQGGVPEGTFQEIHQQGAGRAVEGVRQGTELAEQPGQV